MTVSELNKELGNIDLYLLDLILKGSVSSDMKILDAGCGEGRNLMYFINNGFDIHGVDTNPMAIKMLQMIAKGMDKDRFVVSSIEEMPFQPNSFNFIICSAVLHFAHNHAHFHGMMSKLAEVLKSQGVLFIRMTTDIGAKNLMTERGNGIYSLADGTERYVLLQDDVLSVLEKYHLKLVTNLKSVVVVDQRSMGTLVLQKID
jgi:ubiquinone/menaquinone biosynthesis C-methylase UbiE